MRKNWLALTSVVLLLDVRRAALDAVIGNPASGNQ
jgi:hypothetical protein